MKLRVKGPKGQEIIEIDPSTTLLDFKNQYGLESISAGFPPKKITNSDQDTLEACGIKPNDTLLFELRKDGSKAREAPLGTTIQPSKTEQEDHVNVSEGVLVVREMKDDNSCLFRSIGQIFLGNCEVDTIKKLRSMVSDAIIEDPVNYNEAILGREPFEYCEWIRRSNSWGGGIELAIFSDIFKSEISSVDISTGRMDRFGEGKYSQRAYIMYSGIHYDVIAVSPSLGSPFEFDRVLFDCEADLEIDEAVFKLAHIWKVNHRFTDLANFTLKCATCQQGLKGQNDAQKHALETGHSNFTEYN